MSTLNVNNIDKESGSTLTIGGSGTTVNVSNMVPDVALSNRSLIINGAMNVAQRGTQAGQGASSAYSAVDRFEVVVSGAKTAIVTSSKQATTTGEFSSQLKIDCTTAQASVASGDLFVVRQRIEGQNLQHLQYGTSSAKTLTASFTITSPKSGIHCVQLHHRDAAYSYVREFTVDAANTAQRINVTFPGYTATALDNDNNSSLELAWPLIAGSDWQTTKDGWTSGNDFATSNQQNLLDSTANDFLITGVQLEVGDVATPFEHESFGQTLAKCQRYFYKTGDIGTSQEWYPGGSTYADYGNFHVQCFNNNEDRAAPSLRWPVALRARPTVTYYPGRSDVSNTSGSITVYNSNTLVTTSAKPSGSVLGLQAYFSGTNNDAAAYTFQVTADAEL